MNKEQALQGKRILVTRAKRQAKELSDRIAELGGEVIEVPLIKMIPIENHPEMEHTIKSLPQFDWIIFTSANGVSFFIDRLHESGIDIQELQQAKIVAVGPKTAKSLERHGLQVLGYPSEYRNEGLITALGGQMREGEKVLLPRAKIAREILPQELRNRGLNVTELALYDTVLDREHIKRLVDRLKHRTIDIITFTSSSTVNHFMTVVNEENLMSYLDGIRIACIGPVTEETAKAHGLFVDGVADEYTIDGLVEVLKRMA